MSVFEQLKQQESEERAAAELRYAKLLRVPKLPDSQVAELRDVMNSLGKTAEDGMKDFQIIRRADDLLARIILGREGSDAVGAAQTAADEKLEANQRAIEVMRAELFRLQQVASELSSNSMEGQRSEHDLRQLIAENESIFPVSLRPAGFARATQNVQNLAAR